MIFGRLPGISKEADEDIAAAGANPQIGVFNLGFAAAPALGFALSQRNRSAIFVLRKYLEDDLIKPVPVRLQLLSRHARGYCKDKIEIELVRTVVDS